MNGVDIEVDMKLEKQADGSFNFKFDIFEFAAFVGDTEYAIADYDGKVPDGFQEYLEITIRGHMRTLLNEFGIKDTEAAIRQLSFYGRRMAKERHAALVALTRMLLDEQESRLEP